MSRSLLFILSLLFISPVHAVTLAVYQMQGVRILGTSLGNKAVGQSVGVATIAALRQKADFSDFTYAGDENYISSMNGLGEKTETLHNGDIKASGWCFTLNGVMPNQGANQIKITSQSDEVVWYYGYMLKTGGEWQTVARTHSDRAESADKNPAVPDRGAKILQGSG